jgi:hypothetical protein
VKAEWLCLKERSVDAINSIDYHKNLIAECDIILSNLNPDLAEKREQKERIDSLESQLKQLMEMNQVLMARLSDGTSKTNNNESLGA